MLSFLIYSSRIHVRVCFYSITLFKCADGRSYLWEIECHHGDLILRDAKTKEVVLHYDAYNSAATPSVLCRPPSPLVLFTQPRTRPLTYIHTFSPSLACSFFLWRSSPPRSDKLTISSRVAAWKDLLVLAVLQPRFKFARELAEAPLRAAEDVADERVW